MTEKADWSWGPEAAPSWTAAASSVVAHYLDPEDRDDAEPPKKRKRRRDDGSAPVFARPKKPKPSLSGGAEAEVPADDVFDVDAVGRRPKASV